MLVLTKLLLFLTVFIKVNESSNILLVNSIKSFSHVAPLVELAKALSKREHNVTLICTYHIEDKLKSFRNIVVNFQTFFDEGILIILSTLIRTNFLMKLYKSPKNLWEKMYRVAKLFTYVILKTKGDNSNPLLEMLKCTRMAYIKSFFEYVKSSSESLLEDAKVKDLLADPNENFDIVIIEQFTTFATQGFCYHFKAYCIIYTPIRISTILQPLIGYFPSLSYVRDSLFGGNTNLSFFQNLQNLALHLYAQYLLYYSYLPEHDALLRRHFKDAPDVQDLMFNVSLVLQNSHPSVNSPAPEPPNVIEIGGFHIQHDDIDSEEIKEFLDSSKQDVVYFCIGSVVKSTQLSDVKINVLLKAFSKLNNVTILWKYEKNNLIQKPDNVKIVSWAPQKIILAHPKVKLFISHGGMFGIMEAVYFAKPVMGLPVFADQLSNMMYLESVGMGKYINIDQITEEVVITFVNDILSNARYSINAKENSKLFRDQPMHPMDKAIYWIEYVLRHKGISRPALDGSHFPKYNLFLLDVIFFILCIIGVVVLSFIKCIRFVKYGLNSKCKKTIKDKVEAITKKKKNR